MPPTARKLAFLATAGVVVSAGLPATAYAGDGPINLPLTNGVRTELVQAGAALTGRPTSEFGGLREGESFYAEDPASGTQWAAASLYANSGEYLAGVQLQDQNSYMSFMKPGTPGSTWIPTAIGFGPIPAGQQPCPLPHDVRDVWGWPAGECYPPPV